MEGDDGARNAKIVQGREDLKQIRPESSSIVRRPLVVDICVRGVVIPIRSMIAERTNTDCVLSLRSQSHSAPRALRVVGGCAWDCNVRSLPGLLPRARLNLLCILY